MRYHLEKPCIELVGYGERYVCDHPVYNICTLFRIGNRGLAVVQQRFDPLRKQTYWDCVDPWICGIIYVHSKFRDIFDSHADIPKNGIYPTVPVRKIMWELRIKPLPKERWETVFDRKFI